jgi:hypothetical protein
VNDPQNASGNDSAARTVFSKAVVAKGNLAVLLPKGASVPPQAAQLTFDEFRTHLRALGYVGEPQFSDYEAFVERVSTEGDGFLEDQVLLRGTAPSAPKEGFVVWLNKPPIPPDLAVAGTPFLRVMPPEPAAPGLSVFGEPIEPSGSDPLPDPLQMTYTDGIEMNPDGTYQVAESGQVRLERTHLVYSKGYVIVDSSLPQYKEAEFPCDVTVKGDLVGTAKWKVFGNFLVEGHWSAPNIEVHGNAQSASGLQTQGEGVVKIFGSMRTTYIQFSRIGIAGDLVVDSSIVQSDIRVGGSLVCRGDPGVIMGSEVSCFGAIIANRVGSDKGRRTRIQIHRRSANLKPPRSKIGILSKDTRMRVFGDIWTQTEDGAYETPDVT